MLDKYLGQQRRKGYDRYVSILQEIPQLLITVAEPELCRRSCDDDKITGYRDVRDVGDLILTLVTKSNDSQRKPDPERYTLPLVDFLEQTLTESACHLKQVLPLPLPTTS
jgi:hypothetical protein